MAIGTALRLYPLAVYPEYAARSRAGIMVYSAIQKSIDRSIREKHAAMPAAQQNKIRTAAFRQFLFSQKNKVREMKKTMARQLRAQEKTLARQPFLMEVDPYYYLGLTRRLLERNTPARPVRGRQYLNEMMLAPGGAWYPVDYHPFTGLAVYRLLSFFGSGLPLETAVGYTPLFLSALAAPLFFFIGAKLFALGRAACFLGAVYLLSAPIFLRRSLWGWYDTDAYNVLFPLAVLGCLFLFLRSSGWKKSVFFLGLAAAVCSVY